MLALTASVLGMVMMSPVLAPVPPDPPPDPMGRAAIGVSADENTLQITTVYPKMPAGKAGIRTGDRIIRIGMVRPHTFQEVVNQVCSYRPGAVVEIEIERGMERKVFQIKAVARPAEFDRDRGQFPITPLPEK